MSEAKEALDRAKQDIFVARQFAIQQQGHMLPLAEAEMRLADAYDGLKRKEANDPPPPAPQSQAAPVTPPVAEASGKKP